MAEVNYMAGTSNDDQFQEPSVEIVDPKFNKSTAVSVEDEISLKSKEKDHPNRPSEAVWRQQKLTAWQPILTADTVLPAFFLLGIAFIPIGVGLLISTNHVQEIIYDYTDCHSMGDKNAPKCSEVIIKSECECRVNFTLDENFKAPVYFYYGLSEYFQNHRRYVQSKDDAQLAGKPLGVDDLTNYCDPYKEFKSSPIAPCGAIANSLFNDSFKLVLKNSKNSEELIDLIQTDIAWPTDKDIKFKNPEKGFKDYAKPLYWRKSVDDLDPNHPNNNGYRNEHLIIWMRTSAFPSFRKLWGRIDHDQNVLWRDSLPKGNYELRINYNYPVIFGKYDGKKMFIISNTSWLGGKNVFLGYAYIVVGSLCIILWIAFLIIVKKMSQNPKEMVDIGPKTPYHLTKYRSTDVS